MSSLETKNGFSDAVLAKNTPILYYISKNNCPACNLMANPIDRLQSESTIFPLS